MIKLNFKIKNKLLGNYHAIPPLLGGEYFISNLGDSTNRYTWTWRTAPYNASKWRLTPNLETALKECQDNYERWLTNEGFGS